MIRSKSTQTLETVDSTKYLGINFHKSLSWKPDIDSITKRANNMRSFLSRNLIKCSKETKGTAYRSLVRPFLEYASPVWDPHTKTDADKIERVQRRAARFVCGDYRQTSSVSAMIRQLNWDSFEMSFEKGTGQIGHDVPDRVPNRSHTNGHTHTYAVTILKAADIAYGGILNNTKAVECRSTDELKSAIRFAIKFAKRRWPHTVPTNDQGKILTTYKAENCSVLELVYSDNGVDPSMFLMEHPTLIGQVVKSPLYWGYSYRFQVSWSGYPESHSFLVTEYYGDLYIYQHTFHPDIEIKKQKSPFTDTADAIDHSQRADVSIGTSTFFGQESVPSCPASVENNPSTCPNLDNNNCGADPLQHIPFQDQHIPEHGQHQTQSILRTRDTVVHSQLFQNLSIDFSILNLNIWNTNSVIPDNSRGTRYIERIKNLAKLCNSTEADVIAFQEVRFEDGRGGRFGPNQVQHLSTLLPQYQFVYEPAQIQEHGIPRRIEEGVAIFSRFPIVDHDVTHLTRDRGDIADTHQRILLDALIDIPVLGKIHVMTTHLSLSHVARQRSVVEIWSRVRHMTEPVFLMGDFNAEAHNDEVRFLSGLTSLHGVTTRGLHDLWLQHHGSKGPGFTFSTLDDELTKRIDLIFMKEHPSVISTSIEKVDDGQRKEKVVSDHLGLLVNVRGFGSQSNAS